jgi:hypothetical protein
MVGNKHAALRLAHPTVVPDEEADEREADDEVDITGPHPTVRAARGD